MTIRDIKQLAKNTLGTEETSEPAPEYYVQALQSFLSTNPMDIHFIMELGREGQSVGGNGFGSVTCMEDYCWEDIVLDADSTVNIAQQKKMGLGSFFNFKVHCQVDKHVRGRNERCRKEGITITATKDPFATPAQSALNTNRPGSDVIFEPFEHDDILNTLRSMDEKAKREDELMARGIFPSSPVEGSSTAGPSRTLDRSRSAVAGPFGSSKHSNPRSLTTDRQSSPTRVPDRLTTGSTNALQPIDPNSWTSRSMSSSRDRALKPFGSSTFGSASNKGRALITDVSDDDDDDVVELLDDRIPPGMRKSNKVPPIIVRDQDIKPPVSSQRGSSQSSSSRQLVSAPSRSQSFNSSQPNGKEKAPKKASALPRREVQDRYQRELAHLRIAHRAFGAGATKNDYNRKAVADRYHQVELYMTLSATSTTWIPPPEVITRIVPSIKSLVKSFDKPSPSSSPTGPRADPFSSHSRSQNAVAGPSSRPLVPIASRPSIVGPNLPTPAYSTPGQVRYGGMPGAFPGKMDVKPDAPMTFPEPAPGTWSGRPDTKPVVSIGGAGPGPAAPPFNPLENLDVVRKFLINPTGISLEVGASIRSALGLDGALGRMGQAALPPMPGMEEFEEYFAEPNRPDNLQEFFTNSLNSFDEDQDVEGALQYLELQDLQHRYKDLSVTLMPHQVLGVKFMIEQEKKPKMRGGLLADSMGLGKTLSSIAVIAGHPSEDRKVKTTLVVAPLALLEQWKAEIESKTTSRRKVLIHWGGKRTGSANELKRYDVVLTTYGILSAEHGKTKRKGKAKARPNDDDDSDDGIISLTDPLKQGPLFKVMWYRVILDEAHSIRNKTTRASSAAWDLNSVYRWCLTGTPVMNTLGDLYPLLHFLNISPQAEWKEFNAHIMKVEKKKPNLAVKRMQAILKTCSIRRNKDSTLNGVRLLNLPPKVITWDELDLTVDERHIYTSIENRMQVKFNAMLKRGTVLKHYSMVLVMLVRLKQATSHPFLLTRRAEDAAHPEDVVISDEELMGTRDAALLDDMKELQRAIEHMGQEYVDKVAQMLEDRWKEVQKHPDGAEESNQLGTECSICFEPYEHEHAERVTECCHSYCATCMENLWNDAPRTSDLTEAQLEKNMRQCPLCREPISRERVFRASAFFNPEEQADIKPQVDGEASTSNGTNLGKRPSEDPEEDVKPALKKLVMSKGKGKAVDYKEKVKAEETPDKKPEAINFDEIDITPSTKMRHLFAVIQEKLQDPTVKVVAYSQFTSFLDLCGAYLQANGISALQYQGSMKAGDRQATLNSFNTPPDLEGGQNRVLLLSLKAGGVGLNLTVSNVVIALDLAWNAATEDQAVDRCHRIGQVKEVDVRRLCVKNSIDERIRDLQENKRKLADGALGEGEGGKLGRLSIGDLIRLFNVDGGGHDV